MHFVSEEYWTASQIHERTGWPIATIYNWVQRGKLPSIRVHERCYLVPRSAVEAFKPGRRKKEAAKS
jgi:excisionase family DNA binding protein